MCGSGEPKANKSQESGDRMDDEKRRQRCAYILGECERSIILVIEQMVHVIANLHLAAFCADACAKDAIIDALIAGEGNGSDYGCR